MQPESHQITVTQIDALLPQTQCGKCGHPGCRPYAEGIVSGEPINRCPPGGSATIAKLAQLLDRPALPLDPAHGVETSIKTVAFIREAECIGCTKCIQACPVDAIVGAAKLMHTVITDECTGCDLCVAPCPVDCIDMVPRAASLPSELLLGAPDEVEHWQEEQRQIKADRARQRFERRNQRLAKVEAEKARKREQRQAAAAQAKQALAEQGVGATDLVAAAMARLAQRAQDPNEQRARLERQVASAQSRVARAEQQWQEVEPDNIPRREKFSATLKQAQRNLSEAQLKLQAFLHTPSHAQAGDKIIEKLTASSHASAQSTLATLHKHLAIAQQKLAEAEREKKPTLDALRTGVEKLQAKLAQAQADVDALEPPGVTLTPETLTPDEQTLAAAEKVLAKLAAKQQQSPEQKQMALRVSIQNRIAQLQTRINTTSDEKILGVLHESLKTLEEKLHAL